MEHTGKSGVGSGAQRMTGDYVSGWRLTFDVNESSTQQLKVNIKTNG